MLYLYGYREIKQLTDERLSRSLAELSRRQAVPEPRLVDRQPPEADVIELVFGTACLPDRIGA